MQIQGQQGLKRLLQQILQAAAQGGGAQGPGQCGGGQQAPPPKQGGCGCCNKSGSLRNMNGALNQALNGGRSGENFGNSGVQRPGGACRCSRPQQVQGITNNFGGCNAQASATNTGSNGCPAKGGCPAATGSAGGSTGVAASSPVQVASANGCPGKNGCPAMA